jgi:hypothetical protein
LPASELQETAARPRLNRSPSDLPPGFPVNLRHTWQLVNQPRAYTASLRERFGDVVSLDRHGQAFVIALTPEAVRQVLSADPDGYDAFWKEGFSGVAGPGSLWVLGGNQHRRERQLLLSDYEMRIVLAHIVTHWEFIPPDLEREIRHDIAIGPKNRVRLHITGRRTPPAFAGEKRD